MAPLVGTNADVLSRLVGQNARMFVGNRAGDIWSDLNVAVAAPASFTQPRGVVEYVDARGERRGAAGAAVGGTPWIALVAFPRDRILLWADPAPRVILKVVLTADARPVSRSSWDPRAPPAI